MQSQLSFNANGNHSLPLLPPGTGNALQDHHAVLHSIQDQRRRRRGDRESSPVQSTHSNGNAPYRGAPRRFQPSYPRLSPALTTDSKSNVNKQKTPERGIPISEADKEIKALAFGEVYSAEEESLRNDLNEAYLNTGRRPQNFLQGVALEERFSEYPKLEKLLRVHSALVEEHAHPPTHLNADLHDFPLTSLLPTKYDCILIDPPLEEYTKSHPLYAPTHWSWDDIANLPVPQIAANRGFIWLWVGSGKADENGVSGLDKGRELLAKWGYRRCEDIVWLKTNTRRPGLHNEPSTKTVMTHTKEHCLMGIRGTVRRSTDNHFVHCNIDTDVIVWEGDENNPLRKPKELYNIIENFCLGTRRLELFGSSHTARRGWLTVGLEDNLPVKTPIPEQEQPEAYVKEVYDTYFSMDIPNLVPTTAEVEALRPRSPGGPNRSTVPLPPGVKTNPQGIGRHTNRAATPSASQQLEFQQKQTQLQQQQSQQQRKIKELERQQQQMASQSQGQFLNTNAMNAGYLDPNAMMLMMNNAMMGGPAIQQSGAVSPVPMQQAPMSMIPGMSVGMPMIGNLNLGQGPPQMMHMQPAFSVPQGYHADPMQLQQQYQQQMQQYQQQQIQQMMMMNGQMQQSPMHLQQSSSQQQGYSNPGMHRSNMQQYGGGSGSYGQFY